MESDNCLDCRSLDLAGSRERREGNVHNHDCFFGRLPSSVVLRESTQCRTKKKGNLLLGKLELETLLRRFTGGNDLYVIDIDLPRLQSCKERLDHRCAIKPEHDVWFFELKRRFEIRNRYGNKLGHSMLDFTLPPAACVGSLVMGE